MRILMLSQFYPPIQGGEEQSVSNLSRELAARGHHVAVATIGPPGSPPFEEVDGVRVHRIKGTIQRMQWLFAEAARRHAPPIPDPELTLALARLVRSEAPDIVHAHNWLGYQYLPLKALGGPPLVVTTHDMSIVCATKAFMYDGAPCSGPGVGKCLECTAEHYGRVKGTITAAANSIMGSIHKRQADMFLPVSWSAAMGNQLVGSDLPFQVVPNFLSDDAGRAETGYEKYLDQLPDSPFLLFVGGLRRIKGIEILLRAYGGLRVAPPLVLIGYDCLDTPNSWPESVVVLKNWPHAAVMQAWRRCMVGLVPSICQETFGLVALEAMACGKPVIASRIGGLQEVVVDGETGFLVEPGNIAALQSSIERVLSDSELRERLGAAARTRADQFRASAVVPQFERAYRELIAKRHGEADQPATARLA